MVETNCKNCGKLIRISSSRFKNNKNHCCSVECSSKVSSQRQNPLITANCLNCNNELHLTRQELKRRRFCSRKCAYAHRKITQAGILNSNSKKRPPEEQRFDIRIQAARKRARIKGLDFDIDHKFLNDLFKKQQGRCAISGIDMIFKSAETRKTSAPSYNVFSIDRIDSNLGYTKNNVQLVANSINMMKSYHSEEEIKNLLQHICDSEQKKIKCLFKKLHEDAKLPTRESIHNAGFDVCSIRYEHQDDMLIVYTGIAVQPEMGYYFFLAPRSSTFQKYGLLLGNSIGVIDQNYTGEIIAKFQKLPDFKMPNIGDRLIQLIPQKAVLMEIEQVDELPNTDRGQGGFGSSGN